MEVAPSMPSAPQHTDATSLPFCRGTPSPPPPPAPPPGSGLWAPPPVAGLGSLLEVPPSSANSALLDPAGGEKGVLGVPLGAGPGRETRAASQECPPGSASGRGLPPPRPRRGSGLLQNGGAPGAARPVPPSPSPSRSPLCRGLPGGAGVPAHVSQAWGGRCHVPSSAWAPSLEPPPPQAGLSSQAYGRDSLTGDASNGSHGVPRPR